jgi:hypothetical protein
MRSRGWSDGDIERRVRPYFPLTGARPVRSLTADEMEAINIDYQAERRQFHSRWEADDVNHVKESEQQAVEALYPRRADKTEGADQPLDT